MDQWWFWVGLALQLAGTLDSRPAQALAPGLDTVFTSRAGGPAVMKDYRVSVGVALYVPAGEPPTPFLSRGPFEAEWTGQIMVDLRSDMVFRAEVQGRFALEINGVLVLEHEGRGGHSSVTERVRLNKGGNAFRAVLASPVEGDTWVRLFWGEEESLLVPVPSSALGHKEGQETPEAMAARQRSLGRELALEHRCFKCHVVSVSQAVPELAMDAPTFEGIGARRRSSWMARWIEDPRSLRTSARMPALVHGQSARADAEAMAAFLASLTRGGDVVIPEPEPQVAMVAGSAEPNEAVQGPVPESLFEALHCQACHAHPGRPASDPGDMALDQARAKFTEGKLAEFLRQPEGHYRWIGMPNFRLTVKEADELAQFILSESSAQPSASGPTDGAVVARGRDLVQSSGCLNCHRLELDNRHLAPGFLSLRRWDEGCLAEQPGSDPLAPRFGFGPREREALRVFGRSGIESLGRHVASEFAERQTRLMQCGGCHGRFDGFPGLEVLGGKLTPEWMERFISGGLPYRPRPWLYSRMPVFQERARPLALGLVMGHGYAPVTVPEPPVRPDLAKVGHRLVGKEGGFSCVSCHGVGAQKATEVFEAEGINLTHVAERLQPSYYRRWLLNPALSDPRTKMPVYFERGTSPLTEVLEGDAGRQIEAMWEYFRLKDAMPAPDTGASPSTRQP